MLSASPRLAYRRAKSGSGRGMARRFSARLSFLLRVLVVAMETQRDLTAPELGRQAALAVPAGPSLVLVALDADTFGDVALRGLSMVRADDQILTLTAPLFDGLYEYRRRAMLLGREPS
jgi:hypothetical protein